MTKTGKKTTKKTPSSIVGKEGKAIPAPPGAKKVKATRKPCVHGKGRNGLRCVPCYKLGIGGAGICIHLGRKERCKKGCDGKEICEHGINKQSCREGCGGSQICEHGKTRSRCGVCKKPGEGHMCKHHKPRSTCKECGGSDYCVHGRQKTRCAEGDCHGSQVCEHGRMKFRCDDCNGSQICPHHKQRESCSICNSRYCTCCGAEKTAALNAMCPACLSKMNPRSVEEIHLASYLCLAFYGDTDRLPLISGKKVANVIRPFDMVFDDILTSGVLLVEHDSLYTHTQEGSLNRDTKKSLAAINNNYVLLRNRHVDCPTIEIDSDQFHVVEFAGYSSKWYSKYLAEAIVDYVVKRDLLSETSRRRSLQFLQNVADVSDRAFEGANSFIQSIVLGV